MNQKMAGGNAHGESALYSWVTAFFAVKALFVLMLFGLLSISRIFDSEEEREDVERIRTLTETRCEIAQRVLGGDTQLSKQF